MPAQAAHALQSKRDGHLSLAKKQELPSSEGANVLLYALRRSCALMPRLTFPREGLDLHALETQQGTSSSDVLYFCAGAQRIDWLFHKKPLFLMHWKDGKVPQEVQVGSCAQHK